MAWWTFGQVWTFGLAQWNIFLFAIRICDTKTTSIVIIWKRQEIHVWPQWSMWHNLQNIARFLVIALVIWTTNPCIVVNLVQFTGMKQPQLAADMDKSHVPTHISKTFMWNMFVMAIWNNRYTFVQRLSILYVNINYWYPPTKAIMANLLTQQFSEFKLKFMLQIFVAYSWNITQYLSVR